MDKLKASTAGAVVVKTQHEAVTQTSQSSLALKNAATLGRWWRIADFLVFGLWLVLVDVILQHHEPWADESQSWLLARDLDLKTLWFHELRYNGTPGLWHTILWVAQHWFHAPYAALGVIGVLCAASGVAFILWKAPFPRPLSYLLVFSYVLVYQYAVVARSYNLLPLMLFAAAYLYGHRSRPVRMTVVLILLANISTHGTLLAASLGLCYLIEAFKERSGLSETVRTRYLFCIAAMLLTFFFVYLIVRSTPDVPVFAQDVLHRDTRPHLVVLESILAFALLDHPAVSAVFLLLAGIWCFKRQKLLPFVLPVALLLMFLVGFYGRPHHHGIVFLAAIAGLWIAWPSEREMREFSNSDRLATCGVAGLLVCLFCVNIWDAAVTMRNDYLYPYSGSADAASYLRRVGADGTTIFGYTYGMAGVQAYFDHNILANMPTTYYHGGLPLHGAAVDLPELQAAAPEYVIIFSNAGIVDFQIADPPLRAIGYNLVHYSPGTVFYKRITSNTAGYYIYRRVEP